VQRCIRLKDGKLEMKNPKYESVMHA
jgi:hypothetical protein